MSGFKAKMHQIDFRWDSAPDPAEAAYSALPDPLAVFKGLTSKVRDGVEGKGKGRRRRRERKKFAGPMSNCFLRASVKRFPDGFLAY